METYQEIMQRKRLRAEARRLGRLIHEPQFPVGVQVWRLVDYADVPDTVPDGSLLEWNNVTKQWVAIPAGNVGGGGGGGGGGTGVIVEVDDVPVSEIDFSSESLTPLDTGTSVVTKDGVRLNVAEFTTEPLDESDGIIPLSGIGTLVPPLDPTTHKVPTAYLPAVDGTEQDPVALAALNTHKTDSNAHVTLFNGTRKKVDPVPWTDISGAPGGISSPRIDAALSDLVFNTTALETTFAELVIPANTAATGDEYEFEVVGDLLNFSTATVSVNMKLYWSGNVASTGPQNITSLAARRAFRMRSRLIIRGTGDQAFGAELVTSTGAAGSWVPLFANLTTIAGGDLGVDMTSDLHVKLTCTFGTSHALVEGRRFYALLNRRRP